MEHTSNRRRPPKRREASTTIVHIGDNRLKLYLTVGLYEDGTPCEVFLKSSKSGSTMQGALDMTAIMISHALQFGMPLSKICNALIDMRFEPLGMTDDPDVPTCSSIGDYIAKKLAHDYPSAS